MHTTFLNGRHQVRPDIVLTRINRGNWLNSVKEVPHLLNVTLLRFVQAVESLSWKVICVFAFQGRFLAGDDFDLFERRFHLPECIQLLPYVLECKDDVVVDSLGSEIHESSYLFMA